MWWHWESQHLISEELYASCSSVRGGWRGLGGSAVRGSACQDDCRVTGHVGIWIAEGEQLQATMYSAATELCLWVDELFFFFSFLLTALKIFIILAYAVWRGPGGCKSFKRVWMEAYPLRTGTRCIPKLIQSEWSILSLDDLVLHLTNFSQCCIALLCCSIKSTQCRYSFTNIFCDTRQWIEIIYNTVWLYNFSLLLQLSFLIMTLIIVIFMEIYKLVCASFFRKHQNKIRENCLLYEPEQTELTSGISFLLQPFPRITRRLKLWDSVPLVFWNRKEKKNR